MGIAPWQVGLHSRWQPHVHVFGQFGAQGFQDILDDLSSRFSELALALIKSPGDLFFNPMP